MLVLPLLASGCVLQLPPTAAKSPTPEQAVLYLNLVWHNHQPLYYKDQDGVYTRPWVRAHATKDYYDMPALVAEYPDVHVTFNLSPVLIRQLDDLASGAKDAYRSVSEVPADRLTLDERRFILERFFDANWDHVITRFPRYLELLDLRGRSGDPASLETALGRFGEQDFRDLQVWWNLAWFDPSFLSEAPLKELVDKGAGFSEAEKGIVFQQVDRIVAAILPLYRQLQDQGQIEVSVTPYAHPILPLLYATDLAAVGDPGAELPDRFSYPNDAIAQVQKGVDIYQQHFGRDPRGLWPGEGAVSEEVIKFVSDAGFEWMASGEPVLARSLGLSGFTRNSEDVVQEADGLYRPYYVQFRDNPPVGMVFRDVRLSDMIGFEYSGDPPEEAAADFMSRLEAIRQRLIQEGADGPHLVSVILDGENAWEYYDNDGIDFLRALYQQLSQSQTVRTITASEYLTRFPEQRTIDQLWPGAWFSSDYSTWIGETEENQAWEDLLRTRQALAAYDMTGKKTVAKDQLDQALDNMYLAEGSDWFWWYGGDQDSGNDGYFDQAFRALLRGVYTSLGEPIPDFVSVPIIPAPPALAARQARDPVQPILDGQAGDGEWDSAAAYEVSVGPEAGPSLPVRSLYAGFDAKNLYFRLDADGDWAAAGPGRLEIYWSRETHPGHAAFTRSHGELLGFGAAYCLAIDLADGQIAGLTLNEAGADGSWMAAGGTQSIEAAEAGSVLEAGVPFAQSAAPMPGEAISLRAVWQSGTVASAIEGQTVPLDGPGRLLLPDLSQVNYFLTVEDPPGDDHGPGSYTYPTDPVFETGVFDLRSFKVGIDGDEFVFRFDLNGPVHNPWNSGIQLSVQTFDVYIDFDPGTGTGARQLLEGRNAALGPRDGWDLAVWAEGWQPKVFTPDASGAPQAVSGDNLRVVIDPNGSVTVRARVSGVEGLGATKEGDWRLDPSRFGYLALVLSQEGYPSPGVRRVRDVELSATQWRLGGGPPDTNHTRILDLAWPTGEAISQESMLSNYASSNTPVGQLGPDEFAQLQLLRP